MNRHNDREIYLKTKAKARHGALAEIPKSFLSDGMKV